MNDYIIRIERLSKQFRLGVVGYGTLYQDVQSWWARLRGRDDPNSLVQLRSEERKNETIEKNSILALDDVSFNVHRGETLAVIGSNGAGKSTLLKILSRITAPSAGHIIFEGRIASLLEVGTGFHLEMTGRQNIFLNGAMLGMRRNEILRKFDEIVDFSGVERFIDTPVKRYSSGMYVRLAFAIAAHLNAETLIVDEVLAVGDAAFQKKCTKKMRELVSSEGRTILFVSHNMNSVRELCKRAVVLEHGRLIFDSPQVEDAIRLYRKATEGTGLACWMPKDESYRSDWFTPRRFALENDEGMIREARCSSDEEIQVVIEGDIKNSHPDLAVGYTLFNEVGNPLYCSFDRDCDKDSQSSITPTGRIVLSSRLPTEILKSGNYRLQLEVVLKMECRPVFPVSFSAETTLSFELNHPPKQAMTWYDPRPGEFVPEITWESRKVTECVTRE